MKSEDVKVYEAWVDIDDNLKMTNDYSDDEYLQLVTKSDFDALSLTLKKAEKEIELLRKQRNYWVVVEDDFANARAKVIENLDAEIKAAREEVK